MTSRRALVTGATGFVGSHLVCYLMQEGWQVEAIVRPSSDPEMLLNGCRTIRLHTYTGTAESMQAILSEAQPDVVFHLASLSISEHQPTDVERLIQSNLLFGTQLVEAMTQAGVATLVNTGTFWQHYQNHDYSPVNLYAATKQAYEGILQYYIEARNLRVITLKLHDTYGPDDPRSKLINLLFDVANNMKPLKMSPGEQLLDLVHVDDVVAAFRVAGERLLAGNTIEHERYSVSSGQLINIKNLVEEIEEICGCSLPIEWGGRSYRKREVMKPWSGNKLPGWKPEKQISDGLRDVHAKICHNSY